MLCTFLSYLCYNAFALVIQDNLLGVQWLLYKNNHDLLILM